jgi:xylan 1,4-beta-xylosidase
LLKKITLTQYRIDNEHSNSYEVWKKMGSPQNPTHAQIQQLEKAGQLQTTGKVEKINVSGGTAQINITLPRQGVSLLKMNW